MAIQAAMSWRAVALGAATILALAGFAASSWSASEQKVPSSAASEACPPASEYITNASAIYLGNGCFWERQWAYVRLERTAGFGSRSDVVITSKVGYAGGVAPAGGGSAVCYHTGDARDYTYLGHAEVVEVRLDPAQAQKQFKLLADDFFASFTGDDGERSRPDPGDRGSPYRSVVGLPGGTASKLYPLLETANTHGMVLKPGRGGERDESNVVWVYDSLRFPYFDGEVYHQFHSNFFRSEGMPYSNSYLNTLWNEQKRCGRIRETGCPENRHWRL